MSVEKTTGTNVKQAVPFFHVSNMEESLRYYVDGLGFEMTKKWIDEGKLRWCWLEIGDASLMLQEFRKEGHDSWKPSCKVGEGVSICFMCEDALTIYREATSHGVKATESIRWKWLMGRVFLGSGWLPDRFRKPYGRPRGDGVLAAAGKVIRDLPFV